MEPLIFCDSLIALWLLVRLGPGEWREDPDKDLTGWT